MDRDTLAALDSLVVVAAATAAVVATIVMMVATYPLAVAGVAVMVVAIVGIQYPVVADKAVAAAIAVAIVRTVDLAQIDLVDRVATD